MRKNIAVILIFIMLGMCLVPGLSGCSAKVEPMSDEMRAAQGIYSIYYMNTEGTALIRHDYRPKSEDFDGILNEILDAYCTPDTQDVRTALPPQVTFRCAVSGINEIDVDFNAEYLSLDMISELLLRASLVRTLLWIPGVDVVRFTVESQSLTLGEEEVGPMTADTFIIPAGEGINSYRNAALTLYFPTGDGEVIQEEKRNGYYSSNLIMERLVIEQMLKGPEGEGLLPVAVDGTLLQNVSVSNGYCIVDFSKEINSIPAGETIADSEAVLYAFTNAIIDSCTDDRITGVRFRIDGSSDVRFRDQVNLDQVFKYNSEIITSK